MEFSVRICTRREGGILFLYLIVQQMIALAQAFFTTLAPSYVIITFISESYDLIMRQCEHICMGAFDRESTDEHITSNTDLQSSLNCDSDTP